MRQVRNAWYSRFHGHFQLDALTDPRTGAQFYTMRVSVPETELKKLKGLELRPGMQGTVVVKTDERSLLAYLLRPLFRRFNTALGER